MATITDFRELKCWQEARSLTKDLYAITRVGGFAQDFGLKDQIQRAAVSIGSNIAEGFERDNNSELVKFIGYSKGSTGEVVSQLYTAYDVGYITEVQLIGFVSRLQALASMLGKFQSYIRNSKMRGTYYKKPETRNPKP